MIPPIQNPVSPRACDIHGLVRREMTAWKIPGAAVGVVIGDRIAHAAAYGLRNLRRHWPVTEQTLFTLGSCTKSFTATAAAILVDDGLLEWDRPVCQYLPSFRLADPTATRQATLRDLLSHQVGLAPHNELNPSDTRTQRLARLRHLAFAQSFRSGYLYNNKMYLAAGALIERVSGMPYETFVRDRILLPLGMTATCFARDLPVRPDHAPAGLDLAVGYLPGQPRKPWFHGWAKHLTLADIYHSCGADQTMHANLADMCRWLQMQVNAGHLDRCHPLSPRSLQELRTPQVCASSAPWLTGGDPPTTHYAMGWVTQTWRSRPRIFHGGTGCGCTSRLSFLPDDGIGVVVLCNTYAIPFIEAVTLSIFDRVLGLDPIRWTARFKQQLPPRQAPAATQPRRSTRPPRPLGAYTGRYRHPGYGEVTVLHRASRLQMHYGPVVFRMRHDHDDIFETHETFTGAPVRLAAFHASRAGTLTSLAISFEPAVPPILFRRICK